MACFSQSPKRELRGAWIATYSNIDWPDRKATPQQQRDAFIQMLDYHKATGINAVYVQVRSQSDAMYPSDIEPWSADLTGAQGVAPSPLWDPLQFMIQETHKRGIEFHAWINPYRAAGNAAAIASFAANHVTKQHPGWLLRSGQVRTLDPGLPEVRDYIMKVIKDIVSRYDVDGIHFDDYFYPEAGFNDDASFAADPRGFTTRADWRRDNVNLLIRRVYTEIKALKPWVQFGVSPSGIYRNSTDPAIGSPTGGMEHYSALYADSKKWLQEGWVDYIEPQVYWYAGQPGADYNTLVPWWSRNAYGRHIYIGMGTYKVDKWSRSPWGNVQQIPGQVRLNRSLLNNNIKGQAFYNSSSMVLNLLGFRDSLRSDLFRTPALLPSMPWRDSIAPQSPASLIATMYGGDSVVLNWAKSPAGINEMDKASQYVVYRSLSPLIDINDPANIIAVTADTFGFRDTAVMPDVTYYYSITALDRLHNESDVSNTVAVGRTALPVTLNRIGIHQLNEKHIQLDWATAQETGLKEFGIQKSADGSHFAQISSVPAYGGKEPRQYVMTDSVTTFNTPVYYRLAIADSSGKETFSKIVSQTTSKDADIARLRFTKGYDIRLTMLLTGNVAYTLYDEERKRVTWGKIQPLPVNAQVIIPRTKELAPGNYVINLQYNNVQQNVQLVVP